MPALVAGIHVLKAVNVKGADLRDEPVTDVKPQNGTAEPKLRRPSQPPELFGD